MTDQSVIIVKALNSAPRQPARRRPVSRDALLAAALELFLERGFSATRVEDIARRADVGKGSIYLHFRTKEELFQAVVDAGLLSRLEQAEQLSAGFSGSATELLQTLLNNNLLEFWGSASSGIPKLVIAEAEQFPDIAADYYRRITVRTRRILERILQRGIDQGEYRLMDVPYTARCILGALDYEVIIAHSLEAPHNKDFNPHQFIAALLELVTQGTQLRGEQPS